MTGTTECCGWDSWGALAGIGADGRRIVPPAPPAPPTPPVALVPRVVIVGGRFGGLAAARALAGAAVDVTVVDRDDHRLYQPLLDHAATAGVSPAEIAMPIRTALQRQRNARVLFGEVTSVDLDARAVRGRGIEVPYDYLVFAPGARHSYLDHPEWDGGVESSPLTRTLGVPLDGAGRVAVDAELRLPSHREVFVIGDAAAVYDGSAQRLPGVAAVAVQSGWFAGHMIRRLVDGRPARAFIYRDRGILAAIGRAYGYVSTPRLRFAERRGGWMRRLVHVVLSPFARERRNAA